MARPSSCTDMYEELARIRAMLLAAGMKPGDAPTLAPFVSALDAGWRREAERLAHLLEDVLGLLVIRAEPGQPEAPAVRSGWLAQELVDRLRSAARVRYLGSERSVEQVF